MSIAGIPGTADEVALRGNRMACQLVRLVLVRWVVRLEPLASAWQDDVVRLVAPNIQRCLTGRL